MVRDGRVSFAARVLSQDHRSNAPGGAYSTRVHFEVLAEAERRAAMQILGKEAAWASLVSARQQKSPPFYLLGKGVTDLAEPLIKALASLPIVPHACAQIASATCTCGDFSDDAWCKHVAAVGYHIINSCEIDPFYPFYLRQLDIAELSNIGTPKRVWEHAIQGAPQASASAPLKRARQPECICLSDDEDGSSLEHAIKCD